MESPSVPRRGERQKAYPTQPKLYMRVIIQRVKSSAVTVNQKTIGKIGRGLNLLVGIAYTDKETEIDWMARKCLDLRLFQGD